MRWTDGLTDSVQGMSRSRWNLSSQKPTTGRTGWCCAALPAGPRSPHGHPLVGPPPAWLPPQLLIKWAFHFVCFFASLSGIPRWPSAAHVPADFWPGLWGRRAPALLALAVGWTLCFPYGGCAAWNRAQTFCTEKKRVLCLYYLDQSAFLFGVYSCLSNWK